MKESQTVLEWQREARIEGRQEGFLETRRADILRILEGRFGAPVPIDLTEALQAITETQELDTWFDAAFLSADLATFRAAVGRPDPAGANGVHPPPP